MTGDSLTDARTGYMFATRKVVDAMRPKPTITHLTIGTGIIQSS